MTPGFDWGLENQGLYAVYFFCGLGIAVTVATALIGRWFK